MREKVSTPRSNASVNIHQRRFICWLVVPSPRAPSYLNARANNFIFIASNWAKPTPFKTNLSVDVVFRYIFPETPETTTNRLEHRMEIYHGWKLRRISIPRPIFASFRTKKAAENSRRWDRFSFAELISCVFFTRLRNLNKYPRKYPGIVRERWTVVRVVV